MPRLLPLLALALVATPSTAETADAAEASRTADEPDPKTHWAFKAPTRPAVPKRGVHPIDAFVRTKLERERLPPSTRGLLDPKVGGPSVFAPAPPLLFQPPASYGPFEWADAQGGDRYRRGLHTFHRRSTPYPALAVFDAPVGEQSCVKRTRTNTPLQALTALNETVFMEAARALGARAMKEGGKTDAERITFAFRLCVARKPTADELAVLVGLLEKQRDRGSADPAAFALVARVLLNLDETITKE